MRVVIEVVAGPLSGRKFHLVRNQRLEVGSTARADVCVRGDGTLAPQHFALETDQQVCRVRDLSRQGATLVNGQAVESAVLRSGDEIRAGNSRFIIHVEGAAQDLPPEMQAVRPAKKAPPRRAGEARYQSVVCDTGLTRYEAACAEFPPHELAAALAADWSLYLMADNRRLQDAALAGLAHPRFLFDWLGEGAAAVSPLIITPGELEQPASVISRGWGKDAVVACFAHEAGEAVVQTLRAGARAGQDSVLGICWPKILSYLLSHYRPDLVRQLMTPLACVLIEDPVAADRWQLYAPEPIDERLAVLRLKAAAA